MLFHVMHKNSFIKRSVGNQLVNEIIAEIEGGKECKFISNGGVKQQSNCRNLRCSRFKIHTCNIDIENNEHTFTKLTLRKKNRKFFVIDEESNTFSDPEKVSSSNEKKSRHVDGLTLKRCLDLHGISVQVLLILVTYFKNQMLNYQYDCLCFPVSQIPKMHAMISSPRKIKVSTRIF
jgi:hypothetical protein